jgi:Ca-activated chloride channel family protein
MHFLWPQSLWLLMSAPALTVLYLWLLRRRKKGALKWPSLVLVKEAQLGGARWRRHVPPALFLLSLIAMVIAMARPTARVTLPLADQTLILAMDISVSMSAADVVPDRITAAQDAAKRFVASLPSTVRVGIVSFAGTAALVQAPTSKRDDVFAAIDRFQLQPGTAIGSGIVVALATLLPDTGIDLPKMLGSRSAKPPLHDDARLVDPVEPGSYSSAAIVLLTDGQRTTGPDAMTAAKMAADRGVRVYTVGIGTKEGKRIQFDGWSMRVKLDEDTLKNIASATRAEYFNASTADDLADIYQSLQTRIVLRTRETEVTALMVAMACLFSLLSAGLSLLWFNRVL